MPKPTEIIAKAGKQELFIIREFDAPREVVFNAFSDPELIIQWLGPHNLEMKIDHYDSRSGGSYRYVHADGDGNEFGFCGAIHEVTPSERIIQTFEFEGMPERGHVSLDTALFAELPNGRTKVTMQSVFRSVEDRDGLIASGMESGLNQGFERLDQLLIQTAAH